MNVNVDNLNFELVALIFVIEKKVKDIAFDNPNKYLFI